MDPRCENGQQGPDDARTLRRGADGGSRSALTVLLASATLTVMAGAVISPVVALIRESFRLSAGQAGLVITMHSLFIAVSGPAVGAAIDRVGTKRVVVPGLVAYGVLGTAGALAASFPLLLLFRAAFGIAAACVINGVTVSLLNLWHGSARDTVMGYRMSANSVGGVVWPIVGGALGGIMGWHGPFVIYLIALPVAVAAVWRLPDSRPVDRPAAGSAGGDVSESNQEGTVRMLGGLFHRTPVLLWLYALMFFVQVLLYAIVVFVPQRLYEFGVTQPLVVSMFIAGPGIISALVGVGYGRIRRRLSYRQIFLTASVLTAGAFAVMFLAIGPWLLMLGALLFGPGRALMMAAIPVHVGESVPGYTRGRVISYMSTLMMLGQFASPLLLGPLAGPFGIPSVFLAGAAGSAVAAVAIAAAFPSESTHSS